MLLVDIVGYPQIIRNIHYLSSFFSVYMYVDVCMCMVPLHVVYEKLMCTCKGQRIRGGCEVTYSITCHILSLATVTLTIPRGKLEASKPQWPSCLLVILLYLST